MSYKNAVFYITKKRMSSILTHSFSLNTSKMFIIYVVRFKLEFDRCSFVQFDEWTLADNYNLLLFVIVCYHWYAIKSGYFLNILMT
jgi:hypothetical protein